MARRAAERAPEAPTFPPTGVTWRVRLVTGDAGLEAELNEAAARGYFEYEIRDHDADTITGTPRWLVLSYHWDGAPEDEEEPDVDAESR
jgi:hypothetical protein